VGIAAELNRTLPAARYAEIRERAELGIDPDAAAIGRPIALPRDRNGGVAVAARPRREASPHIALDAFAEPIRHLYVEIRDVSRGHKVITVIEILSPSNKGPGNDREVYETKQRAVLESEANLIELDLLRGGRRIIPDRHIKTLIEQLRPSPAYIVLVNRAWRRSSRALAYNVSTRSACATRSRAFGCRWRRTRARSRWTCNMSSIGSTMPAPIAAARSITPARSPRRPGPRTTPPGPPS
jgi:hypothetical protein